MLTPISDFAVFSVHICSLPYRLINSEFAALFYFCIIFYFLLKSCINAKDQTYII